jgi:hypothetical protein
MKSFKQKEKEAYCTVAALVIQVYGTLMTCVTFLACVLFCSLSVEDI